MTKLVRIMLFVVTHDGVWIWLLVAVAGCGTPQPQQQDFGAARRGECESAYRQIVMLKEEQGMLGVEIDTHEYGRRWKAMSPKEKEAEKAAHRDDVALAKSKEIDENDPIVKAKIERERLQFVERCVQARAMRCQ